MADQFTPEPVKGLKTNNNAAPGADNVGTLPAVATTSAPSYTTGNQVALSTDLTGNLRVAGTFSTSGTQDTNLKQINGNTVLAGNGTTGTGSQRVTIASDNTPFAVKTDQTTHGTTDLVAADITKVAGTAISVNSGVNDAGTIRVSPATDSITKVSATSAANGATNPIFTKLTDGTNPLGTNSNPLVVTTEGSATGTLVDAGQLTSTSLAAGGNATLAAVAVTSGTAKLLEVTASASVRIKVEIQTFVSAAATTVRTFFVKENDYFVYKTIDRDDITFAGASGNKFQVKITNMDNALAADVYATIVQENV